MKHGGDLTEAMARYGGTPAMWLDLSTGINPRPWPVPADLPAEVWQRLPSRAAEEALIAAAREAYAVPADAGVVAAPGTQSLIQWLPQLAAKERSRSWSRPTTNMRWPGVWPVMR